MHELHSHSINKGISFHLRRGRKQAFSVCFWLKRQSYFMCSGVRISIGFPKAPLLGAKVLWLQGILYSITHSMLLAIHWKQRLFLLKKESSFFSHEFISFRQCMPWIPLFIFSLFECDRKYYNQTTLHFKLTSCWCFF